MLKQRALRFSIITVGLLLLWQAIVWVTQFPKFILPDPWLVFQTIIDRRDLILAHAGVTLVEIVLGMLVGCGLGFMSALLLQMVKPIRPWLLPIIVVSQAIPVFALAPILMIWFGYGLVSKIVMASLIIFFPVTSACYDGLRQTPLDWLNLASTMQASKWQQLWHIQLPAAMPSLASGLRVAATVAPIGAVVGEWVGSSAGLGYMMLQSNARMQVDLMFACLFVLAIMALLLYFGVDILLRKKIPWIQHR